MGVDRMSAADLKAGLVAGGAPVLWARVVRNALPVMTELVPRGSRVLEVGYGDGLLTCFLAANLGWNVVGLDVSEEAWREARGHVRERGLAGRVDLRVCAPSETRSHTGTYDAVFIKTVLYSSGTVGEYGLWLDWILSVLRPGGYLVNFETGRANLLTQLYRKARGRPYANLSLYTRREEALYDARFGVTYRRYYGRLSQFVAPIPWLYAAASRIEEALAPPSAEHCFVVATIARKPK